ncbi:MAG TPA: hypothetical protein VJG32_04210 [Anaerolineae bacterium]|nr:hypothetical protein [Anaerolineae bacterium]
MNALVFSVVVGVIVVVIGLFLEHRSPWFARYVARTEGGESRFTLLAETLFDTRERTFNTVALLSSTIALGISFIFWSTSQIAPLAIIVRDLAALTGGVFAGMGLLYECVRRGRVIRSRDRQIGQLQSDLTRQHEEEHKQIRQLREALAEQLKEAYNIARNYRDKMFSYFRPMIPESHAFEVTDNEIRLFRDVCHFVTTGLRSSFKQYFEFRGIEIGEDLSISVKLILPSNKVTELFNFDAEQKRALQAEADSIITVFRDPYTFAHDSRREVGGKVGPMTLYTVKDNTAFQLIVESGEEQFFSNDLKHLPYYRNQNPKWSEHYNATLVVPIEYRDSVTNRKMSFGFLAIDSVNANGLDLYNANECKHILSHAADLLATFFLSLALLKYQP